MKKRSGINLDEPKTFFDPHPGFMGARRTAESHERRTHG